MDLRECSMTEIPGRVSLLKSLLAHQEFNPVYTGAAASAVAEVSKRTLTVY